MNSARRCFVALWLLVLCSCAGSQAKPASAPPAPLAAPKEPIAWLAADFPVAVRVDLAAWRASSIGQAITDVDASAPQWIELGRVKQAYFGAVPREGGMLSAVVAVEGDFGPDYLHGRSKTPVAIAEGIVAEARGGVKLYRQRELLWLQPSDHLLIGFSTDREPWVMARAKGATDAPFRDSKLYVDLAKSIDFEQADLGVLIFDPEGKNRAALTPDGKSLGPVGRLTERVTRGAASLDVGDGVGFVAVADAADEAAAEQLAGMLKASLDTYRDNPFLALMGLRDIIASIGIERTQTRVAVRGRVSQADVDALLARLKPMLESALQDGAAVLMAPNQTPEPPRPTDRP